MWRKRDPRCDSIVRLINQSCNASHTFSLYKEFKTAFYYFRKGFMMGFQIYVAVYFTLFGAWCFYDISKFEKWGKSERKKSLKCVCCSGFFLNFILKAYTFYNPCYSIFVKCFNGGYPRALCVYLARFQEKFANFQWIIIINLLQSFIILSSHIKDLWSSERIICAIYWCCNCWLSKRIFCVCFWEGSPYILFLFSHR